jgi:curved DNA-binding protein CbpA
MASPFARHPQANGHTYQVQGSRSTVTLDGVTIGSRPHHDRQTGAGSRYDSFVSDVDDLGAPSAIPKQNAAVSLVGLDLTPEDYFVFTRVDGRATLGEICHLSGLGEPRTRSVLAGLRARGAILMPGDVWPRPAPRPAATAAPSTAPSVPPAPVVPSAPRPTTSPALARGVSSEKAVPRSSPNVAAASGGVDLPDEVQRRILDVHVGLLDRDLFALLELDDEADKRVVKRAYFKLAKEFHPDRYFGRPIGDFAARLQDVFKRLTLAFDTLSDDEKRAAYLKRRGETERLGLPAGRAAGDAPLTSGGSSTSPRFGRVTPPPVGRERVSTPSPTPTPMGRERMNTPSPTAIARERVNTPSPIPRAIANDPYAVIRRVRGERPLRARRHYDDGRMSAQLGRFAVAVHLLRLAAALQPQSQTYRQALTSAVPRLHEKVAETLLGHAGILSRDPNSRARVSRLVELAVRAQPTAPTFRRAAVIAERVQALEKAQDYDMKASQLDASGRGSG